MWCDYEVVESTNYLFENHNYSPKKQCFLQTKLFLIKYLAYTTLLEKYILVFTARDMEYFWQRFKNNIVVYILFQCKVSMACGFERRNSIEVSVYFDNGIL